MPSTSHSRPRPDARLGGTGSWSRLPVGEAAERVMLERSGFPALLKELLEAEGQARALGGSPRGSLPRGAGRTYGDTSVNADGRSLSTSRLNRILSFNQATGVLVAESGVTLDALLTHVSEAGGAWVVPCCPGTSAVTLGGMVAHDVHGKNHVHTGTLGEHVLSLRLVRSEEGEVTCSPTERAELFRATLAGLGLTGLITSVELQLMPCLGTTVRVERTRCTSVGEALTLLRDSAAYGYGLAWVDSFSLRKGGTSGRCVVLRARVLPGDSASGSSAPRGARWIGSTVGAAARFVPPAIFRRKTMRLVNRLYYRGARPFSSRVTCTELPLRSFLFPQDESHASNRLYGKRGVFAHHSFLPAGNDGAIFKALERGATPRSQSLVTVLKAFGQPDPTAHGAPGHLSFTGYGTSLAQGFPNEGERTLQQLRDLDAIVMGAGGKLYPAKDARMSSETFRQSFPGLDAFVPHIDPAMQSNFWRRVQPKGTP